MKAMKKNGKREGIIALLLASAIALAGLASFLPAPVSQETSLSDWMASLDDQLALSELAIPGSHDAAASHALADFSGACQDSSIAEQLRFGVRFFDLRFRNIADELYLVHGVVNQGRKAVSLFADFASFLQAHPRECLLVSVKEEAASSRATLSFEETLKSAEEKNPTMWWNERQLPGSMKEARGKVVLLSRYSSSSIGIDAYGDKEWQDPADAELPNTFELNRTYPLVIQDHYKVKDNASKYQEIASLLERSRNDRDPQPLYLNFFSGYRVSSFPPSYAMSVSKDINALALTKLTAHERGVFLFDFVSPALAKKAVEGNS